MMYLCINEGTAEHHVLVYCGREEEYMREEGTLEVGLSVLPTSTNYFCDKNNIVLLKLKIR